MSWTVSHVCALQWQAGPLPQSPDAVGAFFDLG